MTATGTVAAGADRDLLLRDAERRTVRAAAGASARVIRTIGGWYWLIFAVVAATIAVLTTRYGSGLDEAVLDSQMGGSSRWVVLVLGMIVPAAYLRLHLAAGGTRATLVAGTIRGALAGGLLIGAMTAVYLTGERALFAALGLTWTREFGPPADGWAGIALTILTEALVVATYYLVGATIAAGYRRLGVVPGTLYVVVALVPAALVDLVTHTGVTAVVVGLHNLPDGVGGVLLAPAGGLVTVALAAWLFRLPLRTVALRPSA
ncbi:hypothetical protein [Promicromonospora iranensis]|uniref:CAAX prenyl protease-like protein n=1 Tax=Promicromonospora iranensis TaxID=1105144 RepID=A0ABU2CQQ4_9MICO|nr:hypothetical protein [Promicromonospora iranensis]MDR7383668.1 hypothetical protein [Promicromonospora iranensis]